LERAELVRYGQIHRNTFVNSPTHLDKLYRLRAEPRLRLAGQLTGVEGYLESAATGLVVALYLILEAGRRGQSTAVAKLSASSAELPESLVEPFPATTALGSLARHLTESDPRHFQPANVNYGLFEELPGRVPRRARRTAFAERARRDLLAWAERMGIEAAPEPFAARSTETAVST
ncbi:MAG TPA: FAD-dependent oxidoreductase, partial [Thermoanaerobaculia bacterium]|nr:FAD-dependent oxidoreductase [Thermoanaerobaculia bacterium]